MAARLRPWRDAVLASRAPWGGWQWTARSVGLGRTRARARGAWPEPEGTCLNLAKRMARRHWRAAVSLESSLAVRW